MTIICIVVMIEVPVRDQRDVGMAPPAW